MKKHSIKKPEAVKYDFDNFYLFHNNITTDNYDAHWHNAVEIVMPTKNKYFVIVDEIPFNMNEFDILIIPSGKKHELISRNEIGQRIILQFDVAGLNALRGLTDVFFAFSKVHFITQDNMPEIHQQIKTLLLNMLDENLTKQPYFEVSIANKIIDLTLLLARMPQDESQQFDKNTFEHKDKLARFQKCVEYIQKNYMENLSLEKVANAVNFSKFHFSRWFQQMAGVTFNEYLKQLRLSKAEMILLSSGKPITEIAMDVGFQSTTTFNRIFKEHNQCTPTEYRRLHHRYSVVDSEDTDFRENQNSPDATSYILPEVALGALSRVKNNEFENPFLWADVPDPSVIRVGEKYYMTSTTMYFNPGCPIMRSTDLVNWDIVNYAYDILDDSDSNCLRNGANAYGKGSWASSLRYHKNIFYIAVASFTTDKTYIFQTTDIENGPWRRYTLSGVYHDSSLFFEDDGRVYLIYKADTIKVIELTSDVTAIKPNGLNMTLIENTDIGGTGGLAAEGAHFYKINGKYYLFLISWPPAETSRSGSGRRLEILYRADEFLGPYEGRVMLDDGLLRPNDGVAQGGIIDTPDGNWYAMLFQDHGAVGRIPVLVPVTWEDDWPVFGKNGHVPLKMSLPASGSDLYPITISDEFYLSDAGKQLSAYSAVNDSYYPYTHLPDIDFGSALLHNYDDIELLGNENFAEGLNHWSQREIAKLSIAHIEPDENKPLLFVEHRITTSSGLMQCITGKLKPGGIYEVKARILYTVGIKSKDFLISIQIGNDIDAIINVGFGNIALGEWGIIKGTFTAPLNLGSSQQISLFIETQWEGKPRKDSDLMDYYVEYVSLKEKPFKSLTHTTPGENEPNGSAPGLQWQFNHNPDNNNWSLTARPGYLRLVSSYLNQNILDARNTLTQRTFGPTCSGVIALETHGLNDGDFAGLCALQTDYGYVGVSQVHDRQYIIMVNSTDENSPIIEKIPLKKSINRIYLKLDFDFLAETARFYYSYDGFSWFGIGNILNLTYKLDHFTGYRFALFYYATQLTGGFADFDYFRVSDDLTVDSDNFTMLNANMTDTIEVPAMHGIKFAIQICMDALPDNDYSSINFSMCIPSMIHLDRVDFCDANIIGDIFYLCENNRLEITISGKKVHFKNAPSDLFATLHFSVNGFVSETENLILRPDYLYANINSSNECVIYNVHDVFSNIALNFVDTGAKAKIPGYCNPLISHKFGADACALVYNDEVYLYMSADAYEYDRHGRIDNNTFKRIDKLTVISSSDLLNWTDHGEIKITGVNGIAHWAATSRKPAIAFRVIDGKEKFFLYFSNGESNIGVLVADTPLGPWEDVLGHPFIHRGIPGVEDIPWCFDPDVLIDDDGSAYLYFGGGIPSDKPGDSLHPKTSRVIQLGDDMISTKGRALTIDAPAFYEASGINKANGKYYFTYCTNFTGELANERPEGYPGHGEIAHMISSSPMGPFEYAGVILKNPVNYFGNGGNSHQCIFNFRDEWFIAYHTQTLARAYDRARGYRSPHINKLEFFGNGRIKPIDADRKGVHLSDTINPYKINSANTFAWNLGVKTAEDEQGNYLTHIHNGDWIAIANVDFGTKGALRFIAYVSSFVGGEIEVRLDNPEGECIGSVAVGTTDVYNHWEERSCDVKLNSGVHHVFLMFKGDSENNLFNLKCWSFEPFV